MRWTDVACVCDCGNTICARIATQVSVYSCGCLHREIRTTHGARARKDGVMVAEFPVYLAWYAQLRSCYSPNSARYPTVGGRGIKMCDRWVNDFPTFLEDVGFLSLTRVDNRANNSKEIPAPIRAKLIGYLAEYHTPAQCLFAGIIRRWNSRVIQKQKEIIL
jgi:hypothetical protein